jgi:hypothetical protein
MATSVVVSNGAKSGSVEWLDMLPTEVGGWAGLYRLAPSAETPSPALPSRSAGLARHACRWAFTGLQLEGLPCLHACPIPTLAKSPCKAPPELQHSAGLRPVAGPSQPSSVKESSAPARSVPPLHPIIVQAKGRIRLWCASFGQPSLPLRRKTDYGREAGPVCPTTSYLTVTLQLSAW